MKKIAQCLRNAYGLSVAEISFLPLGADFNTAVFRVKTANNSIYFLKLRREEFSEASVLIPKYLADTGFKQVIPPLATKTGKLWASIDPFKVILYPYIEGRHGMEMSLSDHHWIEFGVIMKKFHNSNIPSTITSAVPQETFSPKWRETVKKFLERIETEVFKEPIAAKMALFLKAKNTEILRIIKRTQNLANLLQKQNLEYILCHADIHGWNLFIDQEGALYVVDWDTLILAPKERDLMFIGAGIGDTGRPPFEGETLFYQGYGKTNINQNAIAYYRYERVIQDIGEYCEQIFLSNEDGEDRIQSFQHLQSNFMSNAAIERACQSDKLWKFS